MAKATDRTPPAQPMNVDLLAERIRPHLPERGVTTKRMFGGICFLINGNMVCGASRQGLLLRPGAEQEATLAARPHATLMVHGGRRMTGFLWVAPEGLETDADLAGWLKPAVAFASSLLPKAERPPRRRKRAGSTRP